VDARPAGAVTLEQSFERCRQLHRAYGTSYYWATALLPRTQRPYVHALYGFCRYADDIVDEDGAAPVEARALALAALSDQLFEDLGRGDSDDPVLKAVVHTIGVLEIEPECFRRFLASMAMDLSVCRYGTFADLLAYMDGSAAVIGEMMLPVLGPSSPDAFDHARDLGIGFQLTNFIRDVDEDLDRGRVYLPEEDILRFGAEEGLRQRRVTPGFADLLRFEIERTRTYYRSGDEGIAHLDGRSARCVRAARTLYGGILDRVEGAGYDVFTSRVRVPTWQKMAIGARLLRP
jgi:phytoene synthase